jgi:hypothetical protein
MQPFSESQSTAILLVCTAAAFLLPQSAAGEPENPERLWHLAPQTLRPGGAGSFDSVAVKDPSIVFFDGNWHLFYTARDEDHYTTGYVRAERLEELHRATRWELTKVRSKKERYGCAPQVFYFAPHKKWYLLFQNRDSNYQPMLCHNANISDASDWSTPEVLLRKDSPQKWIDFWIICDQHRAHLFYTEAHQGIMHRSTTLEKFPHAWGPAEQVFSDVHEAAHIYKVLGRPEYHMIYERNTPEGRCLGLAIAGTLEGPWRKVTDRYATGDGLQHAPTEKKWTEMVSHGEAIRSGYDQHLEYDPADGRWLIQGILRNQSHAPYPTLPWQLGIITDTSSQPIPTLQ